MQMQVYFMVRTQIAFEVYSIFLFSIFCMYSCYPKVSLPLLSYAGRVKRLCETELGLVSQCCQPKNVHKGGRQYLQNLALKINVKVMWPRQLLDMAFVDTLISSSIVTFGC